MSSYSLSLLLWEKVTVYSLNETNLGHSIVGANLGEGYSNDARRNVAEPLDVLPLNLLCNLLSLFTIGSVHESGIHL